MVAAPSPRSLFNIVCLALILIVFSTILWTVNEPYLGFSLEKNGTAGLVITSLQNTKLSKMLLGQEISYISNSAGSGFTPQPEHFSTSKPLKRKAFSNKFSEISTRGAIYKIITNGSLKLSTASGSQVDFTLMNKRPVACLGFSFCLRMIFGVLAVIMGALVWSWQPKQPEHLLLFVSGVSLMTMTTPSAIEGIPMFFTTERSFWMLEQLTLIGTIGFLLSSALIIVLFPRRLKNVRPITIATIFFFSIFTTYALINKWDPSKDIFEQALYASSGERYFAIIIGYLLILALCIRQWQVTRLLPLEHLQAKSVSLAWLTGPTILMLFYLIPIAYLKIEPPLSRTWAWGCITLSYLMILIGVGRVKLFENERYISAIWNWYFFSIILILIDLFLVLVLNLDSNISATFIILIVLWLYLPLRRWLYIFLSRHDSEDYQAHFSKGISILTNNTLDTIDAAHKAWQQALKQVFNPVSIEWVHALEHETKILNSGQRLLVRGSTILPSFSLEFANGGTRLFKHEDSSLADSMFVFFEKLYNFQAALITGQIMERRRITRDLHDQIGHTLLTIIYTAKDDENRASAHDLMTRLRKVINSLDRQEVFLDSLVGEIFQDYTTSAKIIGTQATIEVSGDISSVTLSNTVSLNILSVFREILSNTIKHSDAKNISVHISLDGNILKVTHKDDGAGFDSNGFHRGFGLKNIAERANEINAEAKWCAPGNIFNFIVKLTSLET